MDNFSHKTFPMPGLDPAEPVVDRARLSELGQMATPAESDALLRELLALYRAEAVPHVARLAAAWRAGDAHGARREAHYLAGSSANLGLARLAAGWRELEALAGDGRLPVFTHFAEMLEARLREACAAYEQTVAELSGGR